jgi:hypothetical protein
MEYHPFGIKFFKLTKQGSMLLTNYGNLQGKHKLFLFQSSRKCFISILQNIDFLNLLWSCYSNFTFKLNLLHMIITYFLGINQLFSQMFLLWQKRYSYGNAGETSIHGTYGYMSSSENVVINLSCL